MSENAASVASDAALSVDQAVGLLLNDDDAPETASSEPVEATEAKEIPAEEVGDTAAGEDPPSGEDDQGQAKSEQPTIEPPASWTAEEKERFNKLPPETQVYLAKRESERDKFVSQKANEAAEIAKAAKAKEAEYAQRLDFVGGMLEQQFLGEFQGVDWNRLAEEDPAGYVATRHRYDAKVEQLQAFQAERARIAHAQQAEQAQRTQALLADERRKLVEAIPEFKDPEKAKAEVKRVSDYLKGYGFSEQEVKSVFDHRFVTIARKAALYDAAQKATATKTAQPVPKVVRPQAAGVNDSKQQQREHFLRAAERGDLRSAAKFLLTN